MGSLAPLIPLDLALQFAAVAAARRGQRACGPVHAAVTAHAQVTFSTLLRSHQHGAPGVGPFSTRNTGKTSVMSFPFRKGPF